MILHYVYHCLSKVAPFSIFFGGLLQCNRQLLLVAASQKWFIKTLRDRLDMTPMSPGCLFCLRECQNQKSPSMAQLFAIVAEIMSCYIMNASGTYFYGCCILFSVWLLYVVIIEAAVEPINVCPSVATHKGKRLPRRARILPLRLPLTSQLRIADSGPVRLAANPSGQNLRHGRCLAWPQIRADHQRLEAPRCCPRPHQQPQQHAFNPWSHPRPTYENGSLVSIHPSANLMVIRSSGRSINTVYKWVPLNHFVRS